MRAPLKDLSRGGASLDCASHLAAGHEVSVVLPGTDDAIAARAVRSGAGGLALVFRQDAAHMARVDQVLDALTAVSRAA